MSEPDQSEEGGTHMKFLAGAAIAAVLFAAAGFAYSARPTKVQTAAAVTPKQFNALKARVAKLEKTTGALATYTVNCLFKYVGIARFGIPPSQGYVYSSDSNPATGELVASALDVTDAGETPSAYVPATTNTACLSSGSALTRQLGAVRQITISARALRQAVK